MTGPESSEITPDAALGEGCPESRSEDRWLFTCEHRCGFALEIEVRFAADVNRDAVDRAAGELVWVRAGVVAGHRFGAVTPNAESFATDRELPGLGLDASLPDLLLAVVERQDPGRDPASSPSFSKLAARISFSPVGTSLLATIFCSMLFAQQQLEVVLQDRPHRHHQYTPVASIATVVTPREASQSRNANRPRTVVLNSRTSCTRWPASPGVRTHAVTCALCTSGAAGRSTTRSSPTSGIAIINIAARRAQQQQTSLVNVLKATVRHSGKDPAPYVGRASLTRAPGKDAASQGDPRILAHFHDAGMAALPAAPDTLERRVEVETMNTAAIRMA